MPREPKPVVPEPQYPEIMRLLESEDFERVNRNFTKAYEILEKMSKLKGLGRASDARKGMKALERVMDLLRDLLRKKYQIMENTGATTPQSKK